MSMKTRSSVRHPRTSLPDAGCPTPAAIPFFVQRRKAKVARPRQRRLRLMQRDDDSAPGSMSSGNCTTKRRSLWFRNFQTVTPAMGTSERGHSMEGPSSTAARSLVASGAPGNAADHIIDEDPAACRRAGQFPDENERQRDAELRDVLQARWRPRYQPPTVIEHDRPKLNDFLIQTSSIRSLVGWTLGPMVVLVRMGLLVYEE